MDVGKGREQERKLFRQTPLGFAGNATSRYALEWPYHGLRHCSNRCAKPKPGASAGGYAFDGAQIALVPIANVAYIVHGSIACAGSSWDN